MNYYCGREAPCSGCGRTVAPFYAKSDTAPERWCKTCYAATDGKGSTVPLYVEKAAPEPPADRFPKLPKGTATKEAPAAMGSGRFKHLQFGSKGVRDEPEKAAPGRFPRLRFGEKA